MKKHWLWTLGSAVLGVVFIFSMVGAADAPETIELNSKVYGKHRKSLVTFTHKKHAEDYKVACADCHHVYKDGKNVWKEGDPVQKCEECHSKDKPSPDERKTMSDAEKMKNFHYEAIHENCKGCHMELKKAGKPTGPVSCTDCHPREK